MNRRNLAIVFALLLAIFLVTLVVWIAIAGPVTVLRVIRYGDTNIDDFSHYPGRELSPGRPVFSFTRAEREVEIPAEILGEDSFGQDFEGMLEANDTIAFLFIQDGTILYERYDQGHNPASLSQLFSVTKSITSVLIGMAVEDGYLDDVDQPITDFLPELAAEGFTGVTIHHLLTMMSGSDYQENDNPFGEHVILNYTPQLERSILSFGMESPPGTVFRYKSGDNALLGLALARALAPETITAYAQRRLWTPLGMQDRGVWSIDHQGSGLEKTWCCLATSARDLAKIGQLFLNEGAWGDLQILPAAWVERSTRGQIPAAAWPDDYRSIGWSNYGYQWWLASEDASEDWGDYFGLGKDGQFLYVNPASGTIIVRLGWSSGELFSSQWISLFQSISESN